MSALPVIAITVGDPSGIGPEIAVKAARNERVTTVCRPRLYGPQTEREIAAFPGGQISAASGQAAHDAIVAAVPRLNARLAGLTGAFPLGESVWEHTWVAVSPDLAGTYRDRFTGLTLETEPRDGTPVLACPTLFGHFPVALLERQGPPA